MKQTNKLLTIVTCTYNRQEKLRKLFNSLIEQELFNFEWLIIDDCSNDNTEQLVRKWQKNKEFCILYHKMQKNGGKYKALNYAFGLINTPLFLIIDSDDYLVKGGTTIISNVWNKYKDKNIGSIIMEHGNTGINDPMLKIRDNGHIDYRYYYMLRNHIIGDYADVFVTSCVCKFRFPEFENENFMSEQPLYYWLSKRYKSVFLSEIITIGEYLDTGLSKNLRELEIKNWQCTLYESNLFLGSDTPLWYRLKKGVLYDFIVIKKRKNIFNYISRASNKWILIISFLPATLYACFKYRGQR